MSRRKKTCKRCEFFKTVQGPGKHGECRFNPPVSIEGVRARMYSIFPNVVETDWCGKFSVNLDKYHVDGKKIYTRVDTRQVSNEG